MNQAAEDQNPSGSIDPLTDELKKVFQKDARSPEENKRRKEDIEFRIMKNRADAKDRRYEELKQALKMKFRGETDDGW